MKIEKINVGNGDKKYPGNFTKREKEIILRLIKEHRGKVLHLFSGKSLIGDIRVDYTCKEATHNFNVFDFLREGKNLRYFNIVIIDPPYNERFALKYQKIGLTGKQFVIFAQASKTTELFTLIREKINPYLLIIKSWNYYLPEGFNEERSNAFLCYAGGYRKSTILMVCRK